MQNVVVGRPPPYSLQSSERPSNLSSAFGQTPDNAGWIMAAGKHFLCGREHAAMAEVELAEDTLIVHVRGMDRLFALRSRLEVPLSHVAGAEADPP
jgi:hypothetical protein